MEYDFLTILKLAGATLLPVVISVVLYLLEKKTKYGKLKYAIKQLIAGLSFGLAAVFATEFGISVEGAILNVRNAAPLTAGLLFGAPAGIISGLIGGVYRFLATFWGAGEFSRVACTIGCIMAGFFGAGCRKFMFGNKKPSWIYGLAIGATTEVLHMLLVFLTNMNDVYGAYKVVAACALPMICANAVSVMLSLFLVALIGKEKSERKTKKRGLSQIFQFLLMICVVAAFAATTVFTFALQTKLAYADADNLLSLNLKDAEVDITAAIERGGNVEEEIRRAVQNRHIGRQGGIIVCDESLKIIYDNGLHEGESVSSAESSQGAGIAQGERFTAKIGETESFCMYTLTGGYYLIATLPVSEAMFSRDMAVTILDFMEVIVFAALFAHVYFLLKKLIVDNIHKVNDSLGQITEGNLEERVNVRENAEFASLSDDINATVDTLKKYIAEAESRIDRELEFARQIQLSSLPSVFPPYPERKEFDIYAETCAAKEVGGDFYDFYFTDRDHLVFLVADVSGKGIPAALFMMRAKTLIKNLAESGKSIDEVFAEANNALSENNEAEMFVTAWLGKLDLVGGKLEYVNAGHNPPLILRNGGEFSYHKTRPNFILAGMSGTKYRKNEMTLSAGDEIFLYTDGVTEAANKACELYGEQRLQKALCGATTDPKTLCKAVKADIEKFTDGAEQSDDITVLCVKLNGHEEKESISLSVGEDTVKNASEFAEKFLKKHGAGKKVFNGIMLAVDEILSNIVLYSGAKNVCTEIAFNGGEYSVKFSDDGAKYDPTKAEEPNVTLGSEERKIGGLGIFIVKKTASSVKYEYAEGKNVLTVGFSEKEREEAEKKE